MQQESCSDTIRELTSRALWEVKNVIDCISDQMWDKEFCEMPLWKHVYHMLHSLDQWYINPQEYTEPRFHTSDLNNLDLKTEGSLSREAINIYYAAVNAKIEAYNASLRDEDFLVKPKNCEWTKFTLILGQYRHLHSHMGMIMGFIIEDTGRWPRVLGQTNEVPTGNYDPFF